MAVKYSRRMSEKPVAERLDLLGEQPLQVCLDAVLDEARVLAQLMGGVVELFMDVDDQPVVRLGGLNGPLFNDAQLDVGVVRGGDAERGGRAHPVQGLVGAAVGVHQHRAVGLHQEEPGGEGQMGFEPANVINGATGYDETHAVHTTFSRCLLCRGRQRHGLACSRAVSCGAGPGRRLGQNGSMPRSNRPRRA